MNASVTAQGPSVLLSHLANFRVELRSQGYTAQTIKHYMSRLRRLDRAASAEGVDLRTLVERHLNGQPLLAAFGTTTAFEGFHALVQFLARKKLLAPHGLQAGIDHLLSRFERHLSENRGLSPVSIKQYRSVAEKFLEHCFKDELQIRRLSARDVLSYLSAAGNHVRYINSAIKTFLRFLFQAELITKPLAEGLPAVRRLKKQRLPRFLTSDQLKSVVEGFPTATAIERRDRAIMLLLARLGLRLREALSLRLEDVDWAAGDILIRGKGDYFDRMALPPDVATVLTAYIEDDRPPSKSACVFVDHKAPFEPLAVGTQLYRELVRTFDKAGIQMPARTGTRVFRHTFATQLVNEGKPIAVVANLLRHRRLNTTMVYARTNLKRLRDAVQPWPIPQRRAAR
jgi:site-specific recombinase XerD